MIAAENTIEGRQKVDLFTIIPSSRSLSMLSTVDLPVPGSPNISNVLQLEQFQIVPLSIYVFLNKYLAHQKNTLANDHEYANVSESVFMKEISLSNLSSVVL